ncbi:MAG: hypothetical protein AAFQ74_20470, partial [Cyanobacteria bacterium J06623_4]
AIRVANNLIAQQNDEQGRADRQRMGTTLVMALVLPQRIDTPTGPTEVNELYLTHVGDSRAYWITPEYCQQLTVDDDIAGREVSMGKSFYATAKQRPDAHALSQAVGVREFEQMTLHTQRFLFESSGVLMLCSDGLSDNHQVEASWANYIGLIVKQIVPLDAAVESWIELANQKNGHDNVAVVLMHALMNDENAANEADFAVSAARNTAASREFGGGVLATVGAQTTSGRTAASVGSYSSGAGRSYGGSATSVATPVGLTPASRALLYGEEDDDDTPLTPEELEAINTDAGTREPKSQGLVTALLALVVISVVGAVGWLLWRTFEPLPLEDTLPPLQEETSGLLHEGSVD